MGLLTPGLSILDDLEAFIETLLPDNAHELATDRLHISMTRKRKNVMVSQFETREDLLKVRILTYMSVQSLKCQLYLGASKVFVT